MIIKKLFPVLFFIVTWNQYQLKTTKPCEQACDGDACWNWPTGCVDGDVYSVQITTHSTKFATPEDADLFLGIDPAQNPDLEGGRFRGVIPENAFNVRMENVKAAK